MWTHVDIQYLGPPWGAEWVTLCWTYKTAYQFEGPSRSLCSVLLPDFRTRRASKTPCHTGVGLARRIQARSRGLYIERLHSNWFLVTWSADMVDSVNMHFNSKIIKPWPRISFSFHNYVVRWRIWSWPGFTRHSASNTEFDPLTFRNCLLIFSSKIFCNLVRQDSKILISN